MKISKLFHWLYAFLMVLPFIALMFNFVRFGLSGTMPLTSFTDVVSLIQFPNISGLSATINSVYTYLINDVFGFRLSTNFNPSIIVNSLTYWTCISIIYLCFDVVMYIPLLVHRWLDKGVIE